MVTIECLNLGRRLAMRRKSGIANHLLILGLDINGTNEKAGIGASALEITNALDNTIVLAT